MTNILFVHSDFFLNFPWSIINYPKKKKGPWAFRWYLLLSFWKCGRTALPDPFKDCSQSCCLMWFYHITSLPVRQKSHIPVSCFSTWISPTAQVTRQGSRVRAQRVRLQPSCYLLPGLLLLCASPHSGASPSPHHHPGLSPFLGPEAELLQGRLTSHLQPTRPDPEPRAF